MSAESETPNPEKEERNWLAEELAALLEALRALYAQISAKLWHHRLEPPSASPLAGDSADINGALGGHIERTAAAARTSAGSPGDATEHPGASVAAGGKRRQGTGARLFSGFARYLSRRDRSAGYQRLGEKMRIDTTRHINDALRLARHGDARGAKVHIELAESAMKTASRYLPEQEYLAFKQEVEKRLKGIVGAG